MTQRGTSGQGQRGPTWSGGGSRARRGDGCAVRCLRLGGAPGDRAKTAFLTNVSHEFRTPLTVLLGPLDDAIADSGGDPEQVERLDTARRNAHRLLRRARQRGRTRTRRTRTKPGAHQQSAVLRATRHRGVH
ncbi:hypothetical protein ALI144C_19945 [Actinosynnema sp. ALI-1.44]|uniref:sensor histidine kinase n=1 Tax=Actinosynnema sp. ALI-1.44 TaxID=1933779 RepID=UPI00097C6685|nr:hypothetical protein ALI144C_19945 [Actinosynnema sp. ALI-1.44]